MNPGVQSSSRISLRAAEAADVERIFRWRNLPEIRAVGTDRRSIPWEEHNAWFERVLHSHDHLLFIISRGEEPIGQVRFERLARNESCAAVSIFLVPIHTGRGFGVEALMLGCCRAFDRLRVRSIVAFVRQSNRNSVVAFEKAGFRVDQAFPATPAEHVALTLQAEVSAR